MTENIMFTLRRIEIGEDFTIGDLLIGGAHICWVCEDRVREVEGVPVEQWKVKGQTAIPMGTYQIKRTWSNRFNATMPQLMDVPGFEGIRIHPGNTAADTEGCLLPGLDRVPKGVGASQYAFREFLKWLDVIELQGVEAWITITGPFAAEAP